MNGRERIGRFVAALATTVSASKYLRARRIAAHRDLDRADLTTREFIRGAMQWQLAVLEQTEALAVPAHASPTVGDIGGRGIHERQIGLEGTGRWDRRPDIPAFDCDNPDLIERVSGTQSFATNAIELPNNALDCTDPECTGNEWDVDSRGSGLRLLELLAA